MDSKTQKAKVELIEAMLQEAIDKLWEKEHCRQHSFFYDEFKAVPFTGFTSFKAGA